MSEWSKEVGSRPIVRQHAQVRILLEPYIKISYSNNLNFI